MNLDEDTLNHKAIKLYKQTNYDKFEKKIMRLNYTQTPADKNLSNTEIDEHINESNLLFNKALDEVISPCGPLTALLNT